MVPVLEPLLTSDGFALRLVGSVLDVVSTTPLITADEVERVGFLREVAPSNVVDSPRFVQMCLDEIPSGSALSFADFGVKPQVVADQIIRFTRLVLD